MASVSSVNIGSGNGLSPHWWQDLIWTNAALVHKIEPQEQIDVYELNFNIYIC